MKHYKVDPPPQTRYNNRVFSLCICTRPVALTCECRMNARRRGAKRALFPAKGPAQRHQHADATLGPPDSAAPDVTGSQVAECAAPKSLARRLQSVSELPYAGASQPTTLGLSNAKGHGPPPRSRGGIHTLMMARWRASAALPHSTQRRGAGAAARAPGRQGKRLWVRRPK